MYASDFHVYRTSGLSDLLLMLVILLKLFILCSARAKIKDDLWLLDLLVLSNTASADTMLAACKHNPAAAGSGALLLCTYVVALP